MPEWLWMIFFLVFGAAMFAVGYFTGRADEDKSPSEHAWINVRRYSVDANKEIAMHDIDARHEMDMELVKRGVFDNPPEDKDDDDDFDYEDDTLGKLS